LTIGEKEGDEGGGFGHSEEEGQDFYSHYRHSIGVIASSPKGLLAFVL
jgi:hypothetical protein